LTATAPPTTLLVISDRAPLPWEIAGELPALHATATQAGDRTEVELRLRESPDVVIVAGCADPEEESELARLAAAECPRAAILVVGSAGPARAERALAAGAHQYLLEPLPPGQLALAVAGVTRQAAAALRDRDRLSALRTRVESMIERAPVPIFLKDRRGRYRIANSAAHEYIGVADGSMLGRRDEELLPVDLALEITSSDRAILAGDGDFTGERTLTVEGESKTYCSSKFPFLDEGGQIVGVAGVLTDLTESVLNDAVRSAAALEQQRLIRALQSSRAETVDRLTLALHRRDAPSGEHVSRMAVIAAWLSELLDFPPERTILLRAAAPMHDVGKIAIRDEILQKEGKLTGEERAEMERHARIGFEMLDGSGSKVLALGAKIALTHHENWDGSGYPRGLRGEEIPIEGRIAAVADVFDALLSDRPYRPAMEPDEARAIVAEGSGTWFDLTVAQVLLDHWDEAVEQRQKRRDGSAVPVVGSDQI
jgi:PAS domain S-box-containing protein